MSSNGKKCRFCSKMNHLSKMCLMRKQKHDRQRKGVNSLEDYENDSTSSDYSDYDSCDSDLVHAKMLSDEHEINRISDDWNVKRIIYDNEILMQIGTSARCNVISQNVLKQMKNQKSFEKDRIKIESLQWPYHQTNRFNKTTLLFQ